MNSPARVPPGKWLLRLSGLLLWRPDHAELLPDLFDYYYEKGVELPRDMAEELHEKKLQYHREEKNT